MPLLAFVTWDRDLLAFTGRRLGKNFNERVVAVLRALIAFLQAGRRPDGRRERREMRHGPTSEAQTPSVSHAPSQGKSRTQARRNTGKAGNRYCHRRRYRIRHRSRSRAEPAAIDNTVGAMAQAARNTRDRKATEERPAAERHFAALASVAPGFESLPTIPAVWAPPVVPAACLPASQRPRP